MFAGGGFAWEVAVRRLVSIVSTVLVVGVGLSGTAGSTSVAQRWVIKDLGTLGGSGSMGIALNDRGQVVGESALPILASGYGRSHAFLWQHGRLADLGVVGRDFGGDMPSQSSAVAITERGLVLGNGRVEQNVPNSQAFVWRGRMTVLRAGADSVGEAINDAGQVVGWSGNDVGYGRGRAFLWQNGRTRDLGTLGGRPYSWAEAINAHGQVVGRSYAVDDARDGEQIRTRAFLWQSGRMLDLGALPGRPESEAYAINTRGQVIGSSYGATGAAHAFIWQHGKMIDLGTLGGATMNASAINGRGQVIGYGDTSKGKTHAFLWQNGRLTDLGALASGWNSQAAAINERGQIVGSSSRADGLGHAFVWQGGKMIDLGTLPGGTASEAVAINRRGDIVGWSRTATGQPHAVLWTPASR